MVLMKNLLLVTLATLLSVTGAAMGADMPLKAPRLPIPVYTWTGFYLGANLGYGWGDARTDLAGSGSVTGIAGPCCGIPNGITNTFGFSGSNTTRLNGVIGGGQLGYNYQFDPKWVLGFEADIQGSGQRGSNAFISPFSTPVCLDGDPINRCTGFGSVQGTSVTAYEARIGWFGTVRGRLGFLITDQVLLYGTGGLAYGQVKLSGNSISTGSLSCGQVCFPVFVTPLQPFGTAFGTSKTNVGFSIGGGIEGKFSLWLPANWTWKLEYLHVDLGSLNAVIPFALGSCQCGFDTIMSRPMGTITTHTHYTDNIVRVGLNYEFGN
jgi:outer membrane immunogenic protein